MISLLYYSIIFVIYYPKKPKIKMKRGHSPSPKPAFRNTRSKFFTKK